MTSTNAHTAVASQQPAIRQTPRRLVPAIPRQLTRPRHSVHGSKERPLANVEQRPSPKRTTQNGVHVSGDAIKDQISSDAAEQSKDAHAGSVSDTPDSTVATPSARAPSPRSDQGRIQSEPSKPTSQPDQADKVRQVRHVKRVNPEKQVRQAKRALQTQPKESGQLPPPFIPARQYHSSSDISAANHLAKQSFALPHHSRPSADSLVFGGYRDSALVSLAAPSTPSAAMVPVPPPALPSHVANANARSPIAPFGQHAAHTSADMTGHYLFTPPQSSLSSHPSQQDWPRNSDFQPMGRPPLPIAHSNGVNSMSRTPSQASSAAPDALLSRYSHTGIVTPDSINHPRGANGFHDQGLLVQQPFHPPPPAPMQQAASGVEMNNFHDLRHFLLVHFGSYDFADYILDLPDNRSIPAHALLLARSPGLQDMMRYARRDANSRFWRISIHPDIYFKDADAFVSAVRYLYGGELVDASRMPPLQQVTTPAAQDALVARMNFALSYFAAGLALDVSDIHLAGANVAESLLCWYTLEPVLDYVLHARNRGSVAVRHIARSAIEYIVLNFPLDFTLDTSASQFASIPLLPEGPQFSDPATYRGERRQSHHRLKSIRFGDAPASQDIPTVTSLLSSVLFSLPFDLIEEMFMSYALIERLGSATVAQRLSNLVDEREKRRRSALLENGQFTIAGDGNSVTAQNMYWEEAVEPTDQYACGVKVTRRRVQ
ncbi:hypothetical protein AAFC00_005955 [Neodothiora populina]|uniref:BTB domain-containing protein n=1 Tax=Neodothiora populina TaxID=2781224 RepID=A0ABR3P6S6_9PEZI